MKEKKVRRTILKLIGPLALVLVCFAVVAAAGTDHAEKGYSTEISIRPNGDNAFLLRATVKDLASGEVLAAPSVKMPAGEAASAESTLPDDTKVSLSAMVDAAKHSATYSVTLKKGTRVVSSHSANIVL